MNPAPEYVRLAIDLGVKPDRVNTIVFSEAALELGVRIEGAAAIPESQATDVLREMAGLLASGAVELPIAARYPLENVVEAFEHLERRHTLGKIVLIPWRAVRDQAARLLDLAQDRVDRRPVTECGRDDLDAEVRQPAVQEDLETAGGRARVEFGRGGQIDDAGRPSTARAERSFASAGLSCPASGLVLGASRKGPAPSARSSSSVRVAAKAVQ